jgi:hypothetical protein
VELRKIQRAKGLHGRSMVPAGTARRRLCPPYQTSLAWNRIVALMCRSRNGTNSHPAKHRRTRSLRGPIPAPVVRRLCLSLTRTAALAWWKRPQSA